MTAESHAAQTRATTLTNGQLALATLGRLSLNVAYRMIYPLLPFLAQHLRVELRTVSALVTVQVLAAFASPLGGFLADTRGERATMSGGLALFCAGAALCAISPSFGGFLAGYALIGLAVALYQPAAQAYLSARTSYERRGWALGVFETSWAAAALVGVAPLMQLVQATGSSAWAFWIILAAGAAGARDAGQAADRLARAADAQRARRAGAAAADGLRGRPDLRGAGRVGQGQPGRRRGAARPDLRHAGDRRADGVDRLDAAGRPRRQEARGAGRLHADGAGDGRAAAER